MWLPVCILPCEQKCTPTNYAATIIEKRFTKDYKQLVSQLQACSFTDSLRANQCGFFPPSVSTSGDHHESSENLFP